MEFGTAIVYTENGEEFNATVLQSRPFDDHMGSDDEPLVDLAFFKEVKDGFGKPKQLVGTSAQNEIVQFRHDVAHESHEYSDEAKQKHGTVYPGGRWREVQTSYFTGRQAAEE